MQLNALKTFGYTQLSVIRMRGGSLQAEVNTVLCSVHILHCGDFGTKVCVRYTVLIKLLADSAGDCHDGSAPS